MLLNLLSYHVYPAPLFLEKDILPTLMCKHIFLSIGLFDLIIILFLSFGLFNLSSDLYVISRNNSLLMETLRFTTLSV